MLTVVHTEKNAAITSLDKLPKNGFTWVDCVDITKDEAKQLAEKFQLHALTEEDLLSHNVRIKLEDFDNYLFAVFYTLRNKGELHEIDFIVGNDFLITNHKHELEICKLLQTELNRVEKWVGKGNEFLFHRILDAETDACAPILEQLSDDIDKLEEQIIKRATKNSLSKVHKLRRLFNILRRTFFSQREKTGQLAKAESAFISKKSIPYFRDIYDHTIRLSDTIDTDKEAVSNVFEVYMSAVSNDMNEVMKTLSIIATIALPLTVISGVYGTNFTNLPGQTAINGFWFMLFGMALLCVVMLFFFKRKRWL